MYSIFIVIPQMSFIQYYAMLLIFGIIRRKTISSFLPTPYSTSTNKGLLLTFISKNISHRLLDYPLYITLLNTDASLRFSNLVSILFSLFIYNTPNLISDVLSLNDMYLYEPLRKLDFKKSLSTCSLSGSTV